MNLPNIITTGFLVLYFTLLLSASLFFWWEVEIPSVPQVALNRAHLTSMMCRRGTERKQRRLLIEEMEEQMGRVLLAHVTPLTAVFSFRYLERILSSTDDNWLAMEQNLRRAQGKWVRLNKILGRGGLDKRTTGRFYVAVVQAVLLFGSKTWVLNPRLEKPLMGFHHRAAWRMVGMVPKRQPDGTWVYPTIGAALGMVGLEEIGVYIARRQNTVAQYIATRPIMDLCLAVELKPGMRL